jgi:asparagine synthase (glutamine-hydrolysing)
MCGIAGIVGVSPAAPVVEAMIRAIAHRGPDGMMVVGGADHMFGHARLAIIDVAGGAQPKLSNSGRWLIVFNGEIYNYRELRSHLKGDYVFSSSSDTEVILAAVECLGIERALAEIDGMYAIALFDREAKVLHLARDHFGIKPLYYTRLTGGSLAFASEMKAFRCLEVPLDVDDVAVATQLLCRCIPAPATGWAGLKKLRPGEWLTFDARGGSLGNARRIVPRAAAWSQSTGTPAELHDLLVQAVARQMVADVPVGILLSGGIDSALVAQIAAQARPDLHSFCVGYSAADRETEFTAAAESARAIGTVHENIVVRATDFVDELRHAVWHLTSRTPASCAQAHFSDGILASKKP